MLYRNDPTALTSMELRIEGILSGLEVGRNSQRGKHHHQHQMVFRSEASASLSYLLIPTPPSDDV